VKPEELWEDRPLFDIARYVRKGFVRRDPIPAIDLAMIRRTVRRSPEVMVKVSGGGASSKAVRAHLSYIGRQGKLDLETDDGERLAGKGAERGPVDGWDLEDEAIAAVLPYQGKSGRRPGKLVHNLILSMPAGTPAERLHAAAKNFAREQFALKNRYAMVLHTDRDYPHVHLVVKAMGESGERLNIRKATLRLWRSESARHLREHGVDANATERQVRNSDRASIRDEAYWSAKRKGVQPPVRKAVIRDETRRAVRAGWEAVAELMRAKERTQDYSR
jgi:hypothetical protein